MILNYILALFALSSISFGQATPTVPQAPPPGIEIPADDSHALELKLQRLEREIEGLRSELRGRNELLDLLPDVEIFAKSVRYAVVYHEFFNPAEVRAANEQLELGLTRAAGLKGLRPNWPSSTGALVRAYRSRIDDSVQPFGLRVPADWTNNTPRPLYLWFHGRNDTLSEVAFIAEQLKGRREFAPTNAFELHLYGRYCNASKFAGEVDALEALEAVKRSYPIDTNRIAELGFSMGGATAWHMAAHFPGTWAVASAGAGFAETAIYAKVFDEKKEPPPGWEQTLWHWYDATDYAANLSGLRMIAYSGEIDPQKQSADVMERALAREGLQLERLVGPNTAHKYEPATRKELAQRIDRAVESGRDPFPAHLHFVTYTLRYNQMKWITLDRLETHWQRADIVADREKQVVRVRTTNIVAFTLNLPEEADRVIVDDQTLNHPGRHFTKNSGNWVSSPRDTDHALLKVHGLTGPIDDAFMDSFLFVRPTGQPFNERTGEWATTELNRAIQEWRRVFRGDARVKNDTEITEDDLSRHNLVLWGDPGSNRQIALVLSKLPLTWNRDQIRLGQISADSSASVPILIFPNPLNPRRYVVLNSSFTFRQGSTTSNSLQTPKLPDWAIVDLRTPPSSKWPGLVAAAGFFDDHWQIR